MPPRRYPKWLETLVQVALSVGVALAGLVTWSHARGEVAGLEAGRVLSLEERIETHENDDEHHFSREDAERLVRVESAVTSMKDTLEALVRRGGN